MVGRVNKISLYKHLLCDVYWVEYLFPHFKVIYYYLHARQSCQIQPKVVVGENKKIPLIPFKM